MQLKDIACINWLKQSGSLGSLEFFFFFFFGAWHWFMQIVAVCDKLSWAQPHSTRDWVAWAQPEHPMAAP